MNKGISISKLRELLSDLNKNPHDINLINKIAIGYMENNRELDEYGKGESYFKMAYSQKKTVKSTHNYAYYIYFEEYQDLDLALEIQEECMNLFPKTYLPHFQYGHLLLKKGNYKKALIFLENARNIEENNYIIQQNIGCCYLHLGKYELAKKMFSDTLKIKDSKKYSTYNLALTEYKLNNYKKVELIANSLFIDIKPNWENDITGYDIGYLYFLIHKYEKVKLSTLKMKKCTYNIIDNKEISYSLLKADKIFFDKLIYEEVATSLNNIKEIDNSHEDWEDYSNEEKSKEKEELTEKVKVYRSLYTDLESKPEINISEYIWAEQPGCLLFDCELHNNLLDDK